MDVELHILPLAKTSEFITGGKKQNVNMWCQLPPPAEKTRGRETNASSMITSQWTSGRCFLSSCHRSPRCMAKNTHTHTHYFPEWAGLHVHLLFLSLSLVYLVCICELTCFTEMPTEHLYLVCDSKSLWVVCAVVTQRSCITAAHTTQGLRKYRGNTNKLM